LSASGEQLVQQEHHAPDVSYPKYKGHFLIGFNTLYGKIRTSMDSNAYFDQYIAVGPGMLWTDKGNSPSGILDIGLAFWMKKWGSMRFGVMNELFKEKRMESAALTHHIIGHIDFGFMFGGGAE
jgi:outer membrane beta-barrel protein